MEMRKMNKFTLLFCKQKCNSNVDYTSFYYIVKKVMRGISFI